MEVARDLLGKLIVVSSESGERVSGMIVETEAYLGPADKAAHSYGGRRTKRNEAMYGVGGQVYIFFVYGMYYQLNFVCGPAEHPHAVLIRAVEPVEGIEIMRERRGASPRRRGDGEDMRYFTSGPGKLCIAFAIDRDFNGYDLSGDRIWLEDYRKFSSPKIAAGRRIGIDYAKEYAEMPWRFWVKGNEFVSRK